MLLSLLSLLPTALSWHASALLRPAVASRITPLVASTDICDLDDAETLCTYDGAEIDARFADQPLEVAGRVADIALAALRVKLAGDDGGETLRGELATLGPVFCKIGQTMATRPDIVGLETSRNLGKLQDAVAPESGGPAVAMATLRSELPAAESLLANISAAPVAAASLAEVYRATRASDGAELAIKIQRPGLERKVALDFHVLRRILALAQEQFGLAGDIPTIQSVLDEVGGGIFAELDFETEARHIRRFDALYAKRLAELGVVVPKVDPTLTSPRVLATEWIDGTPPRSLPDAERQALARTAVRCLAMQLMSDGFIHCDPHEGNLLGLPDGRVALLDFGLMAQMRRDHQEAMASGVLNIMAENYGALEEVFKGMGVLNTQVDDLRRDGVDEPFSDAIRRCMTGGAADERARNLIQDDDGGDRRRAFGQLYEELGELAFSYYFTIPSYYILVMRAFVTLEGIALANDGDEFNMYEATAPYARRTLLTPRTAGGRALLRAAFLSSGGRRALRQGLKLPRPWRWRPWRWLRKAA